MASRKDYYDILGVPRGATAEEIERAFRRLRRIYRFISQSRSKEAGLLLKEITEAYEILANREKRERYDNGGEIWEGESFLWEEVDREEEFPFAGFEDILEESQCLIESKKDPLPQRGKDILRTIELSFQESIWGTEREVKWFREINCPACEGKGWANNSPTKTCPYCGGIGQIQVGLPPEFFFQTCSFCLGQGKIYDHSCSVCAGKGRIKERASTCLQIPPGIDEGCKIYLIGKGNMGRNGGENGDLIIKIKVSKSPLFQKLGYDLHLIVPLPIGEKLLGGEIEIPTGGGKKKIKIPPLLPEGGQIRYPEEGPPIFLGEGRGDLIIRAKVIAAQNLDEWARRWEDFKREAKENNLQMNNKTI